jgi:hypothetical protein
MNEWLMIITNVWGVCLFAAGGTDIPGIGGQKWIRRFLLPIGLMALACFFTEWWRAVGYGLTLCAFLHLGYGERAAWIYRGFIFFGYGAASLWFGWTWWVAITPIVACGLFYASNTKATSRYFPWKIVEMALGFLITSSYLSSLSL